MIRLEMKNYNINKDAAKLLALSSGKIYEYEYLMVKIYYLPLEVKYRTS